VEGFRGEALLQQPVRLRGIQLGRAVDLILDADARRVLGFDVLCGDGTHRFLPYAAADPQHDEIVVSSSLLLLDEEELDFYRERGTTLSRWQAEGRDELVLDADGAVSPRPAGNGGTPGA
jgi:hypothetical protein